MLLDLKSEHRTRVYGFWLEVVKTIKPAKAEHIFKREQNLVGDGDFA